MSHSISKTMAQDKKKIIVYTDWKSTFEKLSDEEAGRLIKHFFSYVNDENPNAPDRLTELLFEPIKQTLKRDLKKWETFIDKQKENGKKGGRPKKPKPFNKNPNEPKKAVSVSDSVKDSYISTKVDNDKKEIKNFSDDKNFEISENLKFNSPSWIESVAMQHKISIDEIQKKIDEFVLFLRTTEKVHKSKREFISHFINWLPKKLNQKNDGKEKQSGGGAKKQFRFSTNEAIETITRDP